MVGQAPGCPKGQDDKLISSRRSIAGEMVLLITVRPLGDDSSARGRRVVRDTARALHEAIASSEETARHFLCLGGFAPRDSARHNSAVFASSCLHRTGLVWTNIPPSQIEPISRNRH